MAEKPVECGHCKKSLNVTYKEIVSGTVTCTEMCADCPLLQHKLQGKTHELQKGRIELFCGNCHTSLEAVQIGDPLGCAHCYEVFSDLLLARVPSKKSHPFHIGKTPNQPATISSSSRLVTLNEALSEALKKENYEQAAWIRDQIKVLYDGL